MSGRYDNFTSHKDCKKVAAQFKSCDLQIVPSSDHMFLNEQPSFSASLIDDFIESQTECKKRSYTMDSVLAEELQNAVNLSTN